VFVCGCFERWVSIHLQATRGLDLAWAMIETGAIAAGARVAVVGGGFAGLAAAAALGRKGARVTLLERAPTLLASQRDNHVRWIHPHLHEWPRPGAQEPRAGLPLLDWTAGLASAVAAEVLAGFAAEVARSAIDVRCGVGALTLTATGDGPRLGDERFDAVVLALGVGVEKSFGALPLASYWADAEIATVTSAAAPRHHLVTGIGEGGVIDTLYLRLGGFAHAELAARLAAIDGMAAVEAALLTIEDELVGLADAEAGAHLVARHAALAVPPAVDALLASRLRADTLVTLNGPEAAPLAPRADIFNRFLLARLLALGAVRYRPGAVEDVAPTAAGWRVRLATGEALEVDRVHVRHGTVPSLRAGFPAVWAAYEPVRRGLPHLTPRPWWPTGYFDDAAPRRQRIFHLTTAAPVAGHALAPPSLVAEGFVHASTRGQLGATANRYFAGARDLVAVEIEPAQLDVPLRYEAASPPGRAPGPLGLGAFPHVYGAVPARAIVGCHPMVADDDGVFRLAPW
jgi:uncharacterized protein (DUF952 family)